MITLRKRLQTWLTLFTIATVPLLTLGLTGKVSAYNFPNCTWTGNGGNNNFSNAANWSGCGGAPVSGSGPINSGTYDRLLFDNSNLTQNEVLNNDIGPLVVHGLSFLGSGTTYGYRISGNPIVGAPGATLISDNTTSTYSSGFNNTLSFPNGSADINLSNPSGTYFAKITGSAVAMLVGGSGGIMKVSDLSGLSGVIAPVTDEIELMPTGDMNSSVIFNNLSRLSLDNQGPDKATYTYNMNFDFANGQDNSNAQIYLPNDINSNVQSVIDGYVGLYSDMTVDSSGNNTLNITAPIADNGYTINSVQNNVTSVSIPFGDDQSSSSPTIGSNVTYFVDGALGDVTVGNGGLLKGTGTVNSADIQSGGGIAPGHSPGCLTVFGNFTLAGTYSSDIQSPGEVACTDYDQVVVGGTIILTGSNLNVNFLNSFVPIVGQSFEIIKNNGTTPIAGTFNGLPEGAVFTVGNTRMQITYTGDGGDNVVLSVVSPVNPVTAVVKAPETGFGIPNIHNNYLFTLVTVSSLLPILFGTWQLTKRKWNHD